MENNTDKGYTKDPIDIPNLYEYSKYKKCIVT